MINIISSGLFSSFQDLGRFGKKSLGVSQSGSLDKYSFMISNILCGNKINEGAIEIIGGGFLCEFLNSVSISVSGPIGYYLINNKCVPINSSIKVNKNDVLTIPSNENGNVFYFSIAGGFDIEEIIGSYSYHQPSNITDKLKISSGQNYLMKKPNSEFQKMISPSFYQKYLKPVNDISIIFDQKIEEKNKKIVNKLLSNEFTISDQLSRQGIKLNCKEKLVHRIGNEISSGVSLGTVQLPPNGEPIILLNDSQTTGGYTKLGRIPDFEISRIVQSKTFTKIKFKKTDIYQSSQVMKSMDSEFNSIKFSDYFLSIHKIKDSFISVQISENGSIIAISNEQLININKE